MMKFKDIGLIYGGELMGKGTDMIIDQYVTDPTMKQYTKVGLAAGLPLATAFIKFPKKYSKVEDVLLLMGAFLATRL